MANDEFPPVWFGERPDPLRPMPRLADGTYQVDTGRKLPSSGESVPFPMSDEEAWARLRAKDAQLAALEAEVAELKAKLQHRAKQVLDMDECVKALCTTIGFIRKVYPEVQAMFDAADQFAKLAKDLNRTLSEDKG